MPTLTTLGGAVVTFSAAAVFAVADHDDMTGIAATCVYGIGSGELMTSEGVQTFMQRLKITASFAQLTRPNGHPVWIRGDAVSMLRAAHGGEYPSAVKSVITVGSLTQAVKETPTQVVAALNAHGGDL